MIWGETTTTGDDEPVKTEGVCYLIFQFYYQSSIRQNSCIVPAKESNAEFSRQRRTASHGGTIIYNSFSFRFLRIICIKPMLFANASSLLLCLTSYFWTIIIIDMIDSRESYDDAAVVQYEDIPNNWAILPVITYLGQNLSMRKKGGETRRRH